MDTDRVVVFDTTLRDAEQTPGASLTVPDKLEIAHQLAQLQVDVIEAGFPISSNEDFEAVQKIAQEIEGPTICGLCRVVLKDVDRAGEALDHSSNGRIHTFVGTSPQHQEMMRKSPNEVMEMSVKAVAQARLYTDDVEFSPMDATRTDPEYLFEVIQGTIQAGANTVNIPDTVGYTVPEKFAQLISDIFANVPNIRDAVVSVHCHDDLGMGVANSLAAVRAGARQIECTVNGIGERAGNASLEELVMALKTRQSFYGLETNIDTAQIYPMSKLLQQITGVGVQPNKAIVGENAFAHEAGIHQDGMLKEPSTYEIMRPEDVGFAKTDLVLGKHSGRAALGDRASTLGYHLNDEQLRSVFDEFKILADKKKEIYDGDLVALIQQEIQAEVEQQWSLVSFEVTSGTGQVPRARLTLQRGEEQFTEELSEGDGPIDAAFLATEKITGLALACKDYQVRSASLGHDAQGEVVLEVEHKGQVFRGRGVSTDTVEATVRAILNAVNRIANSS